MLVGFSPVDSMHTRLSTLLCITELPSYSACRNRLWGDMQNPIAVLYPDSTAIHGSRAIVLCGCSDLVVVSSPRGTCQSTQGVWVLNPALPGDTPDGNSCSYDPIGLWIFGVLCIVIGIACPAVYVSCQWWVWSREEEQEMIDRDRGLDPNDPLFVDAGHNMPRRAPNGMHAVAPVFVPVAFAPRRPGTLRVPARAARRTSAPAALQAPALAIDAAVQHAMVLTMACGV